MPVLGRIGIVIALSGVALGVWSGHWLNTRHWLLVNKPISLAKGHISTGPFNLTIPGEYVASVEYDEFSWSQSPCPEYQVLREKWIFNTDGKPTGAAETSDGNSYSPFSYDFESDKATHSVDLDVLSDASCLDARNPRLVVRGGSDVYDTVADFSNLFGLSVLLVLVGSVLLIQSVSRADSGERPHESLTPFLPRRLSHSAITASLSKASRPARTYATFRHRAFPRRDILSIIPMTGYIYAVGWFVIFFPWFLLMSTWRWTSVGLPVSVVRLDASTVRNDDSFEPLVLTVTSSGQFLLNGKTMSPEELSTILTAALGTRPHWYVYVDADQSVAFSEVARAVGIIRGLGAQAVLVTPKTMENFPRKTKMTR
jgi:biopolymer transport protein ExbD